MRYHVLQAYDPPSTVLHLDFSRWRQSYENFLGCGLNLLDWCYRLNIAIAPVIELGLPIKPS